MHSATILSGARVEDAPAELRSKCAAGFTATGIRGRVTPYGVFCSQVRVVMLLRDGAASRLFRPLRSTSSEADRHGRRRATSPRATPTLLAALAMLWAGGCSDPELVIEVQLFRSQGFTVDDVIVVARQGGKSKTLTVENAFRDCEANRVRVLPSGTSQGGIQPVVVHAEAVKASKVNGSVTITKIPKGAVPLRIGPGPSFQPAACAPGGSVADGGGPTGDSGGKKQPTGSACSGPTDCVGGVCLKQVTSLGDDTVLTKGYCSRKCSSKSPCPAGEFCWTNTDGNSQPTGQVCLKRCKSPAECRKADGYTCTTGNVCLITK